MCGSFVQSKGKGGKGKGKCDLRLLGETLALQTGHAPFKFDTMQMKWHSDLSLFGGKFTAEEGRTAAFLNALEANIIMSLSVLFCRGPRVRQLRGDLDSAVAARRQRTLPLQRLRTLLQNEREQQAARQAQELESGKCLEPCLALQ